jgi:uncharacterized OsmC-like protein
MRTTTKDRVARYRRELYNDAEAHAMMKQKDKERKKKQRRFIKLTGGVPAEKVRKSAAISQKKWRDKINRAKNKCSGTNRCVK